MFPKTFTGKSPIELISARKARFKTLYFQSCYGLYPDTA